MKLIIAITRGLIRDQNTRRHAMFVLVLAALLMLFAGGTFLSGWLLGQPVIFILYWIACGWLTLAAVLLSFLDVLMLRLKLRHERRQLRRAIFGENDEPPPDV